MNRLVRNGIIILSIFLIIATITYSLNNTAIIIPASNQNFSGIITLNATTDAFALNVTYLFTLYNGTNCTTVLIINDTATDTTFNSTFNTSICPNGQYNLTVIASNGTDTITNMSTNVRIDNLPPVVTIVTANNSNYVTTTPTITYNFTDAVFSVASCVVYVGGSTNATNATTAANTNTQITLTVGGGSSTYYVNCTDGSGNSGISSWNNLVVDAEVPQVTTIDSPGPWANLSTGLLSFNTTATDNGAMYNLWFNVSNASSSIILLGSYIGIKWNATIALSVLGPGLHRMNVIANDTLGNINASAYVWFTVDSGAPTVTMINTSFFTTDTTPDVIAYVADAQFAFVSCVLYYNGTAYNTSRIANNTNATFTPTSALIDGRYVVQVNCTDGSSNVGPSGFINVTIDGTAPQVTAITSPTNNANLSTGVQFFNATVTDAGIGIASVIFNITNGSGYVLLPASNQSGNGWNATTNLAIFAQGTHTLLVDAIDSYGNRNNSVSSQFRVDSTAPTVTLINTSFFTTDTTPDVIAYVADAQFAFVSCVLYYNGTAYNTSRIANNTNATFTPTSALIDGRYVVQINCTDGSSNVGPSGFINVTIDAKAPAVTINSPARMANLSTGVQLFNATVTDAGIGVQTVLYNITNGSGYVILAASNPSGNDWNASINLGVFSEGWHNLTVDAIDTFSQRNNTVSQLFMVDITPPTVRIVNLSFNTSLGNPDVWVNFTDGGVTATCSLYFNGTVYNISTIANNTNAALTVNTTLGDGTYNVNATCMDPSGNTGWSNTISVFVDKGNPSVTAINSPVQDANLSTGTFVFNATVTDGSLATVVFNISNGTTAVSVSATQGSATEWIATYNLGQLAEQRHNLSVIATDGSGNINASVSRMFRVDRTPPIVSLANTSFNTTDTTPDVVFNFTETLFATTSCTLYFNGTGYNTSTAYNNTNTNITPSSAITDGTYLVWVVCVDGSSNTGYSNNITVIVDTESPEVTTFNAPTTFMNRSFLLNVTITGIPITAKFRVQNGSNVSQVIYGWENMNQSANEWTAMVNATNTTQLPERNYTIRINATDSLRNSNITEMLLIGIDYTQPTNVTLSCTNITTGSAQSCICHADDNGESYGGNLSYTITAADTTTAGTKVVNCTATDSAGNANWTNATYVVTDAESNSNTGGGGGGGSAIIASYAPIKNIYVTAQGGSEVTMKITSQAIAFEEIALLLGDEGLTREKVTIEKVTELPANQNSPNGPIYQHLNVDAGDKINDKIKLATITFTVSTKWLTENNVKPEDIVLYHLKNGKWVELQTEIVKTGTNEITFKSKTPGFSYFAIGMKGGGTTESTTPTTIPLATTTTQIPSEQTQQNTENQNQPTTTTTYKAATTTTTKQTSSYRKTQKNSGAIFAGVVVALLVLVILALVFMNRGRKPHHK